MSILSNKQVRIILDDRWPRIIGHETADGHARLPGEREAIPPRLYVYRKGDRCTLTSDDPEIAVTYTAKTVDGQAVYHAEVAWEGKPAAAFDVTYELRKADLTIGLANVREYDPFRFLTLRFPHLASATSRDPDSLLVTCGWQGRILDPKKCKPGLVDLRLQCNGESTGIK